MHPIRKDRYGTWIDFVKKHIPVRLDVKRCPVQESQLFMTTCALSSVLFTRAISSHHAKQKPSEDSASRSFPFVLSRERITIVREAIRARPRLALRASEISQNYTVISGGDINAHTCTRNGVVPKGASPVQWGGERIRRCEGISRDLRFFLLPPLHPAANIFINSLIKHTRIPPCIPPPSAKWIHWH